MLVELHSHTNNSHRKKIYFDGVNSTEEMVRYAKRIGLGAIAITDHDTMNGLTNAKNLEKKYGIIIIKGEEITTKSGHILAHGIQEQIQPGLSVQETVDLIHRQGGLATSSHPFDIIKEGLGVLCKKCDAIEAFNSLNLERLSNRKARKFALKNKKPMVAGSDAHSINMIGFGLNRMDASSEQEILKSIKKGNTEIIGNYTHLGIIRDLAVRKLQLSYDYVDNYIQKNFWQPKRFVAHNMLKFVNYSPGKIDYLLKTIIYIALGSFYVYSFSREIKDLF